MKNWCTASELKYLSLALWKALLTNSAANPSAGTRICADIHFTTATQEVQHNSKRNNILHSQNTVELNHKRFGGQNWIAKTQWNTLVTPKIAKNRVKQRFPTSLSGTLGLLAALARSGPNSNGQKMPCHRPEQYNNVRKFYCLFVSLGGSAPVPHEMQMLIVAFFTFDAV